VFAKIRKKYQLSVVHYDFFRTFDFVEGRLHLENENKSKFILYFTRFTLPLQSDSERVTHEGSLSRD